MPDNFKSGTSAIWQDQDGFFRQAKLLLHGGWRRLEKYAIGHEMSNQESRLKTKHLPSSNRKLDRFGKLTTGGFLKLGSFTLLLCTYSVQDPF